MTSEKVTEKYAKEQDSSSSSKAQKTKTETGSLETTGSRLFLAAEQSNPHSRD